MCYDTTDNLILKTFLAFNNLIGMYSIDFILTTKLQRDKKDKFNLKGRF